jgi:hypothetical protein
MTLPFTLATSDKLTAPDGNYSSNSTEISNTGWTEVSAQQQTVQILLQRSARDSRKIERTNHALAAVHFQIAKESSEGVNRLTTP